MRCLPRNIFRCALFLTLTILMRFAGTAAAQTPSVTFSVDTAEISDRPIGNRAGCVNVWRCQTLSPPTEQDRADGADLTPFVEWVEFMQATGSSPDRDLFQDPNNAAVLDDYDFTPLLNACAVTLSLGARPHIKLSVPTKYSSNRDLGDFKTNVFPPDDYEVYGAFVRALARALAERFGLDEVCAWRFGVLTEFENPGWFRTESGTPEDSRKAYFKLYDYTADALCAELGPDICIGAHAMACSEGLWDERDLLDHCASGVNYKTGKTGAPISFMAVSFYDKKPGEPNGIPLAETVGRLRARAEEAGLDGLFYGVDEGRILYGIHSGTAADDLFQRAVGRTYQAAYDARLFKQMLEADIGYFCSWSYSTGGLYHGIPTPSYYVARLFSEFRGSCPLRTEREEGAVMPDGVEVDAVAGFEPETETLRVMLYNFKDDYDYDGGVRARLAVTAGEFAGKRVNVTKRVIDDRVNFFPEWERDRRRLGFGDDLFTWSPDDPGLDSTLTLRDPEARKIYKEELRPKYAQTARLVPEEETADVPENGILVLETALERQGVVFYEIAAAEQ